MKKRLILLLTVLAALVCLSPAALADSSGGGNCGGEGDGSNLQWSFHSGTGTLTISGKGAMADYDSMYAAPWYSLRSQITSLVIEEGVTYVGIYSLCSLSCQDAALELPDSLVEIGELAFSNSGFSGSLTLGSGLKRIGFRAFAGCSFTGPLVLPDGLEEIGARLFENMAGLTGPLELPDSLTSIGASAFSGCSGFTGALKLPNGLTAVEDSVFFNCSGFTGPLELPDGLTYIGQNAFANCTGLTGPLELPDGLTLIKRYAFSFCTGLDGTLKLPGSLTTLEESAFSHCTGLTGLELSEGLDTIGWYAFSGCSGLTGSLDMPASLTGIGHYAFRDTNLNEVFFQGDAPVMGDDPFPKGTHVYAYISTQGWTPPNWEGYPFSYIADPIGGVENPLYISLGIPYHVPGFYEPENAVHRVRVLFHAGLAEEDYAYVPMQIPWGWELFSRPADRSDSYDNRLAIAGLALSGAAEHDSSLRLSQMLASLGFEDWKAYHYTPGAFTPLQARHMIASKDVVLAGNPCTIFAVVCSGTLPSQLEDLISDFIPGGFNSAAEDVRDNLLAYVKDHYGVSDTASLQGRNMKFFFTGHSLGGAVTNLLAGEMEETGLADTHNMYVYTFASPLTVNEKAQLFNVHNIINADDGIPRLSPALCPQRLGTDRILDRQSGATVQNRTETAFRLLTGGSLHGKSLNEIMAASPLEAASILHGVIAALTLPERVTKFFAAHDTTTYMALLLSDVPSYNLWEYGIGSMATFQCPVDLSVYNSAGELVGQTVNHEVNPDVYADVLIQVEETEDGDFIKYVYMPFDDEYTFVVSATGEGTLTYTVEGGGQANTFAHIGLTNGKTFSTQAGGQLPADAAQIFVTEGDVFHAEVEHDGTEVPVTGGIPVNYVTGAPAAFTRGETITLTGRVHPSAAAWQDVTWTLTDAGGTGAVLSGNSLTASIPGTLTLTAAVAGSDYTQDFTVEVWDYPPLMQPYGLKWADTTACWTALEGAAGYTVQLYRDGAAAGQPVTADADTTYVDFSQSIQAAGSYTFTVAALGDGMASSDSAPSQPVEQPYLVEALTLTIVEETAVIQIRSEVPQDALLIAARFEGERMTASAVQAGLRTGGSYTLDLSAGSGTEYRVFLLDAQRRPLCPALRQQR